MIENYIRTTTKKYQANGWTLPSEDNLRTKGRKSRARNAEVVMWKSIAYQCQGKVGQVLIKDSNFSQYDGDGSFAVVGDKSKFRIKGGLGTLWKATRKAGVATLASIQEALAAVETLKRNNIIQSASEVKVYKFTPEAAKRLRIPPQALYVLRRLPISQGLNAYEVLTSKNPIRAAVAEGMGWVGSGVGAEVGLQVGVRFVKHPLAIAGTTLIGSIAGYILFKDIGEIVYDVILFKVQGGRGGIENMLDR